ncbi:MAG TPA: sialate O-acetylesterase [Acidobacteriota bacterium]|nr:sialate O-acetylesterase [Acidobacteriota bacterium]
MVDKKKRLPRASRIGFVVSGLLLTGLQAEVRLPALFTHHMVLQRDIPITIWGWAAPGEAIRVHFREQSGITTADEEGRWLLRLESESYGGPDTLVVEGENRISLEDVMVGEVWICSGQSNMEWKVHSVKNAEAEIAAAQYPALRMFTVTKKVADEPQQDCSGEWQICSPETVGGFSAVGYFFGRELYRNLGVPVGLIHTSWGGTPAESWTRWETLEADEDLRPILERYQEALRAYPEAKARYDAAVRKLQEESTRLPVYQKDSGNLGKERGWADPQFDDGSWPTMELPKYWETEQNMNLDGAVWFRQTVDIPPDWAGQELQLELGAIDDFDTTYFQGREVGGTGEETPNFWTHPRKYTIPGELVKPGPAVIAVRVFDHYGNGGFAGSPAEMLLYPIASGKSSAVKLAGVWRYQIEQALDPNAVTGPDSRGLPPEPMGPGHPYSPSGLYNAMLYPLAPFSLRGAVWYQGESNAGRAHQYVKLLASMIHDWRELWGLGDFPFGIVQLANYMAVKEEPQESAWAELREAQALVGRILPRVGLAVAIDIGEADDIHPRNKQDVGLRLGLWALNRVYGRDVPFSGPVYRSMDVRGSAVRIHFDHTDGGLTARGGDLRGFAIAGRDRVFHWADARIEGDTVIVSSPEVPEPVAVRYAWADNPVCNLYNNAGLPAVPFRTDFWPGATRNQR